jgi:pimeloyl-ACP methyl ester carboxylesterase
MVTTLPKIVLVHGSWCGALAWDALVPALAERGIESVAVELPGRGPNSASGWRVSLQDYGDAINAATDGEPAILVGHSAGGFAITQAACSAATAPTALVYVAAFLPVQGERLARLARQDADSQLTKQIKVDPLRGVLRLKNDGLDEIFYHDYKGDDLEALLQRFVPEPLRPGLAKVKLTQRFHDTPKYYIQCALDRAISPTYQEWMCSRYGIAASAVLDTGHMPTRTDPDGLAELLKSIVEESARPPDQT